MSDKVCKEVGCTTPLRSNNESGYCRPHGRKHHVRTYRERRKLNHNGDPSQPRHARPRKKNGGVKWYSGDVTGRPVQPSNAQPDLVALLEQRRAHHLAEAERCDRALKALKE